MDNLQRSELVIAKILTLLLEWGITSCQLEFEELELDQDFCNCFYPCIEWLADEGVIRYSDIQRTLGSRCSGSVTNPVLTSFGFKVLGKDIELNGEKTTIAAAVQEVKSGNRDYSVVGDLLGGILGGFTKSIGS